MGDDYDAKIAQNIPAEIHMISGSHDSQSMFELLFRLQYFPYAG
jgi:hypothetical protein